MNEVAQHLDKQRLWYLRETPLLIRYDQPLWEKFFSWGWQSLAITDWGEARIDRDLEGPRLRFDVRMLHGFVFCLVVSLLIASLGLFDGQFPTTARFGIFAFAWLYGMNFLLAQIRVRMLFAGALEASRRPEFGIGGR